MPETWMAPDTLLAVYAEAARACPAEACGFILASGRVRLARNIQDWLHADDPASHPRDSTQAFTMSFTDTVFLEDNLKGPDRVAVIWHSHPGAGAYFSATDHANALLDGEPRHRVDHLVVSVRAGQPAEAALHRWDGHVFLTIATFNSEGQPAPVLRST